VAGEEVERLIDRHAEHVDDRAPAHPHVEHLLAVAAAVAGLARHAQVVGEGHVDDDLARALAGLAAAARPGGGGPARRESLRARLARLGEAAPDRLEGLRHGRGVRARAARRRRGLDEHHLVYRVGALDALARAALGIAP